jgi:hypothetical protein
VPGRIIWSNGTFRFIEIEYEEEDVVRKYVDRLAACSQSAVIGEYGAHKTYVCHRS